PSCWRTAPSTTAIRPSPAAWTASGARTNGSTAPPRAATNLPTGGATTTNTKKPDPLHGLRAEGTLRSLSEGGRRLAAPKDLPAVEQGNAPLIPDARSVDGQPENAACKRPRTLTWSVHGLARLATGSSRPADRSPMSVTEVHDVDGPAIEPRCVSELA